MFAFIYYLHVPLEPSSRDAPWIVNIHKKHTEKEKGESTPTKKTMSEHLKHVHCILLSTHIISIYRSVWSYSTPLYTLVHNYDKTNANLITNNKIFVYLFFVCRKLP